MHYFYCLYNQVFENRQGVVDDSLPVNRQGVIDDFESIFMVPWSLHILIIDKLKNDPKKAMFFVKKTIENNWGYGVLLNFIKTDLYERQGAAQTNFALTMPAPESDLAQIGTLLGSVKYVNSVKGLAAHKLGQLNKVLNGVELEVRC